MAKGQFTHRPHYHFKPLNVGRWILWGLFALVLGVAPLLWTSGLGHTMLSQMGIAVIACLAYNVLLGQGGMLSFGHAVYSGLGAFLAIHTLNAVSAGKLAIPVSLVPLMPPSPPKNSGIISDIDHTSSPMPSVIIAKVVPALRVVT